MCQTLYHVMFVVESFTDINVTDYIFDVLLMDVSFVMREMTGQRMLLMLYRFYYAAWQSGQPVTSISRKHPWLRPVSPWDTHPY